VVGLAAGVFYHNEASELWERAQFRGKRPPYPQMGDEELSSCPRSIR
jgi:hypothetical protein